MRYVERNEHQNCINTGFPALQLSRRRREEIKRMQAASAEDSQRTLDTAVALVGTCQEYCPEFEKVERHLRNEVKRPEMVFRSDLACGASWLMLSRRE